MVIATATVTSGDRGGGNTTTVATRKAMVAMLAGILGVENLNQGTESELPY